MLYRIRNFTKKAQPDSNKYEGFTIIEVLIVLAIAGLIMLIVFLAVPALQRNSRNNERRNEASRLTVAFQEYVRNNGNQIPTGNASANTAAADQLKLAANVQSFEQVQITQNITNQASTVSRDLAQFRTRSKCNAAGDNIEVDVISVRRVALLYWLETSNDHNRHCLQVL